MSTAQPEAAIQEELRLVEEDLARSTVPSAGLVMSCTSSGTRARSRRSRSAHQAFGR